jgi:hypothetical protein
MAEVINELNGGPAYQLDATFVAVLDHKRMFAEAYCGTVYFSILTRISATEYWSKEFERRAG